MDKRYVTVDLETTGNSFEKGDRIIQISIVIIEKGKMIDQYTSLVNPGKPIPDFIQELTGIDDQMVSKAPKFEDIADEVWTILDQSIFVAHNVKFDLGFLGGELANAGKHRPMNLTLDTVELAKILLPCSPSYKLQDLSDQMNLIHNNPHQADSDAMATAELFLLLLKKAESLPLVTLEMLNRLAENVDSGLAFLFGTILAQKQKNTEDLPAHLEIFRGIALRKSEDAKKEVALITEKFPSQRDEKANLFQQYFHHFSLREGQFEMMDTVHEALTSNTHALIEAGTGIGKTIAYLFPGIYFAVSHNKQVAISTYTVHLQHQLIENELDKLKNLIPFPFTAALLKGRDHYISLFRFEQSLRENNDSFDEAITKMKILVWLVQTETGDVDELNLSGSGTLFWEKIRHPNGIVHQPKDPWHKKDFYLRAKRKASQADIIIMNHASLIKSLEGRMDIPPVEYFIIDEAHQLEKAVRNTYGAQLGYRDVKIMLDRMGTSEKQKLLYKLEKSIKRLNLEPNIHVLELDEALNSLDFEAKDLFLLMEQLLLQQFKKSTTKAQISITNETRLERKWQSIVLCAERMAAGQRFIQKGIEERLALLEKSANKLTPEELALIGETAGFCEQWKTIQTKLGRLMIHPKGEEIVWIEGEKKQLLNRTFIYGQPLEANRFLSEKLFAAAKSAVLTSASMTVNRSFKFFAEECGIQPFQRIEKIIDSPYDYKKKAKLFIPSDLPEIRTVTGDEYAEAIACHLIAIANAVGGRMLVLFTSHEMLRKTHNLLKDSNELNEYVLLAHGISSGSRQRLLKTFQQFAKSILLGTNSFWEGIDMNGESLSSIVVIRLPFSHIHEPVAAAKMAALKAAGKNPFSAYSLPNAIIQFKQGFGRLIRNEADRGAFFVFDRRIVTTMYGNAFLRSLPPIEVEQKPLKQLIPAIEQWLANQ